MVAVLCAEPLIAMQVNEQCVSENVDAVTNHEVLLPGQLYGMLLRVRCVTTMMK